MKKLINRLICLCRGHEWITWSSVFDKTGREIKEFTCSRCGKIKKDKI